MKVFNHCAMINIMEISDLEVYDWLELLQSEGFSHYERPSGGKLGRTELDERASVERTELRRHSGGWEDLTLTAFNQLRSLIHRERTSWYTGDRVVAGGCANQAPQES